MEIYNNLNLKRKHKKSVIAIGNFDGIHLGHQKVITEAKKKAKKSKLPFGVVTFEPMPVMFFNPKIKNHRINSINQKKIQLKKLNIDFVIIIRFKKIFSRINAEKFIKKIISERIGAKYIFVSRNFKFGRKRHAEHFFCSICGIYTHHRSYTNPENYEFNVACIDTVDTFKYKDIRVFNGQKL